MHLIELWQFMILIKLIPAVWLALWGSDTFSSIYLYLNFPSTYISQTDLPCQFCSLKEANVPYNAVFLFYLCGSQIP